MSEHGPEEHCYWRERYVELEETLAYSFEGFAMTIESERAGGVGHDVARELAAARAELAKLKGSRLGKLQQLLWRGSRSVRRRLRRLRGRH